MKTTLQCTAVALAMAIHVTAFGQGAWHFECSGGLPVKLVWQTQPGQTYNLRETTNLLSWTQVSGFPKVADGTVMEHSFVPGTRRFFQITTAAAGGGWNMTEFPALPAGSTYSFYAVSALNSNQVWVSGNISPGSDACVLRSGDGSAAWALIYREASVGWLWGELQMTSPDIGYVAGTGIRRTADGGVTWQVEQGNQPNPPGTWHSVVPDGYVYGMAVVDAEHVWMAGYDGAIAGVIWHRVPERPQPDPANPNYYTPWWLEWAVTYRGMYGISAVNQTTAWAVGYAGYIWKTTDGQGWGQQISPTGVPLQDVAAVDTNTVWAVGDGGTILKTTNGGAIWIPQVSGTTENLRRIAAVNSNFAWAVGGGGMILHTRDGGTTWTRQFSGTTVTLHGVAAVDTNAAWAVGEGNTVLRTTDGGRGNWLAPTLSSVTPNVVGERSEPPMTVTVTGAGFRGGNVSATFGSTPARSVTWVNESTLLIAAESGPAGTFDLTVVNEDGQSATLPRAVTFVPQPVIKTYGPFHGPANGGYQITVDGFNLQTVNRAEFYISGSDPEPLGVSVMDSTRVLVTVPESATRPAGQAMLVLTTAQNQYDSAEDFLLDPASGPTFAVTSITPTSGARFTTVTVTGVGFSTNATLEVCDWNVTITSRSSTQLVGNVSSPYPGLGLLEVISNETNYLTVDPAFLLLSGTAPTLNQVAPNSGLSAGGSSVTLTGTGFQTFDTVTFDGYAAEITSRTSTSMVVTIPPHAPGTVSVFVMSEDLERGAAVLPAAFTYH